MEVFLYNSTVCRLCGEENDSGTLLYSCEENNQNLCEVINTYLPMKVSDDGELPRTICPGCTIQLEATVEFLNLIISGQKVIRELHLREREYKKTLFNSSATDTDVITEKIVYEINTNDGVYQVEHPIALQVAGLEKPKRKRGRPPKKPKSPEELAQEAAAKEKELVKKSQGKEEEVSGKRRRKTPTRFREAVQGKELDRIFKEEGVTDGEESDGENKPSVGAESAPPKEPEVIGHMETSGELVVVVKGKGRGRPKGRMRPTREQCAICGMEFSCVGRYMSHVAQHGPVQYQCGACAGRFPTRLLFTQHQETTGHSGQTVIPCPSGEEGEQVEVLEVKSEDVKDIVPIAVPPDPLDIQPLPKLPEIQKAEEQNVEPVQISTTEFLKSLVSENTPNEEPSLDVQNSIGAPEPEKTEEVVGPKGKVKLKCNQCEKTFSSKQSKSLHIKAVHQGERPYACLECGCRFAYPRSLALHAISHRRHRAGARRYACDLCGKVLNHPSSVVYHKEAEHAGQRYVCNKCGKSFKHRQLLQRHQLVHSQLRPYSCKTCNASFKTKANLINHQLLHTGVKKFSCEICKHKFAHKTSLTLHMRWHTGSKPFVCHICSKSFSQKGNLSEHERIHTGEKPYACTLCPRRFTTSSQHRLHARRHQPERPYACAHCPKRFVSRGSWAAHQRRESGARSHQCAVCSRGFLERWALLKHMRRHTGERPFRCPHCPRAFADCSNLNKHKKQVHKQISLLVNDKSEPSPNEPKQEDMEESVIYVTYDIDEAEPAFHILDSEQAATLDDSKVLTTCELYPGPSLLVSQPSLDLELGDQLQSEELELEEQLQSEELEHEQMQLDEPLVLQPDEHIAVTDEEGNPLHFTMQDGTRLAITSTDGKSLQVITQDGQTIPVEINGFNEEEEADEDTTIVHQMDFEKTGDVNVTSPVTHFYTIV